MSKDEFLRRLRRALKSLSPSEIDEIVADYHAHFAEAVAAGRSEEATAQALGDPRRLAHEHLSDIHYHEWRHRGRPLGFAKWLLVSAGLTFLLPFVGIAAWLLPTIAVGLLGLVGGGLLPSSLPPVPIGALLISILGIALVKLVLGRHHAPHQFARFEGAGEMVEREFNWLPGHNMLISLPAEVHWKPAAKARAVVRGQAWLVEHIRLDSSRLHGRFQWRFFHDNRIHVDLEGPAIEKWAVVGSSDLYLHDLAQPTLHLQISGSGDIKASGTVQDVVVAIAGSGDVDIGTLKQSRTTVDIAGSGDATVAPSEEAILAIAGSGDIRLLSQPSRIKTSIVGSGDIRMADGSTA